MTSGGGTNRTMASQRRKDDTVDEVLRFVFGRVEESETTKRVASGIRQTTSQRRRMGLDIGCVQKK